LGPMANMITITPPRTTTSELDAYILFYNVSIPHCDNPSKLVIQYGVILSSNIRQWRPPPGVNSEIWILTVCVLYCPIVDVQYNWSWNFIIIPHMLVSGRSMAPWNISILKLENYF
jgi:hypothetical protein